MLSLVPMERELSRPPCKSAALEHDRTAIATASNQPWPTLPLTVREPSAAERSASSEARRVELASKAVSRSERENESGPFNYEF